MEDVLAIIFNKLGAADVLAAAATCRLWRHAVFAHVTVMDFSAVQAWNRIDIARLMLTVRARIKRLKTIINLRSSGGWHVKTRCNLLVAELHRFPELATVRLSLDRHETPNQVPCWPPLFNVSTLQVHNLTWVALWHLQRSLRMPLLKSLQLHVAFVFHERAPAYVCELLSVTNGLRRLTLDNVALGASADAIARACPALQELHVMAWDGKRPAASAEFLYALSKQSAALGSLEFVTCTFAGAAGWSAVLGGHAASNRVRRALERESIDVKSHVSALFARLPRLRRVDLVDLCSTPLSMRRLGSGRYCTLRGRHAALPESGRKHNGPEVAGVVAGR